MGQRKLVLVLCALALWLPQVAFSLGLGEITLKSALNEPLEAEIELLQVRDLTQSEILVGLASQEDFDRVGVDRPYFLSSLRFQVNLNAAGGPVIEVTSRKPVREPFLNFVMQAQWPSGRLLREYTLLIDLPVYSGEQARPVAPPQAQIPAEEPRATTQSASQPSNYNPRSSFQDAPERPQYSQQSSQTTTYAGESTPYSSDSYGPVQANDTLWEIARRVRPDRGVSIQQTMLAIQRLNPEAFINNNINLLRKGQILRVPDRQQITEYSPQQAVNEVAVQNQQWSGDPNGGYPDRGAQIDARSTAASYDEEPEEVAGRVKLSSPEDVSDSASGRASGDAASSLDALENELAITLEQLDKSKRDNSDLRSRITDLEEQITTMERMLEISNEDMRALELAAEQNRQEEEVALAEVETGDIEPATGEDVGEDPSDEYSEQGMEEEGSAAVPGMAETEPTPEPTLEPTPTPTPEPTVKADPTKVVASQAPKKTIVDTILDNIIFLVAGLVILVLVAFFAMRYRSSQEKMPEEDDFLSTPAFDNFPPAEEDVEPEEEIGLDETEEELEREDTVEPEDEPEQLVEPQTEDVVAEADIYIAYGKYDQAEEMLVKALDQEPQNTDIRLKLLEVYSNLQDINKFDPHYARLMQTGDEAVRSRGSQLRETIEDAPAFDASLHDVPESLLGGGELETSLSDLDDQLETESVDDFGELDLDLESEAPAADDTTVIRDRGQSSAEDADDSALDFDLQLDDTDEPSEEVSLDDALDLELEARDQSADVSMDLDLDDSSDELDADDFDLDFDLDSDDVETSSDTEEEEDIDFAAELDNISLDFDEDDKSPETADETDELEDFNFDGVSLEQPEDEANELSQDTAEPDEGAVNSEAGMADDLSFEFPAGDDSQDQLTDAEDESGQSLEEFLNEANAAKEEEPAAADNLDLGDDLDLSALDEELDALTSDLGVEEADLANLEAGDALQEATERLAEQNDSGEKLAEPTVMEEPITDFDELDEGLDEELETLNAGMDEVPDLEAEVPGEETKAEEESEGDDTLFDQAIADVPKTDLDFNIPEIDPDSDDDLGFLSDSDETATKLDLARAYIDMGDAEGAKDILDEIMKEGNDQQKHEAESLLAKV